ncbi:MAG: ABC transporter ATP-binding protein [Ruminiclostridium sp.]
MIELKNISVNYGKTEVLRELSLSTSKGKLISVIGVNGSGKSTLLKAIMGIVPLKSGEITVDNFHTAEMSRRELAKKIAYLAQGKSVPDMTVGQMVLHGRFPHLSYPRRYSEKDRQIADNALEQAGISHLREKPLSALSGGMRQNAYIAMALAQDSDYILLDEPTSYLDIAHRLSLMKTLRSLADSGKGIVTVMHDLPLAFGFSDEVAVVDKGKIAVCDSPENVCKRGIIKEIFGVELKYDYEERYFFYNLGEKGK